MKRENIEMKSNMIDSFGDLKTDKVKELNPEMSIVEQAPDELTTKLHNLGGNQ